MEGHISKCPQSKNKRNKLEVYVAFRFYITVSARGSHNLRKFPQIYAYAVSVGVVLVIMRMHYFQKFIVASLLTTLPL